MYISEVSGHRNAATAIEGALGILKPDIDTLNINAFNYTNPIAEKITNSIYMGIIKIAPQIWDYLYDNPKVLKRVERTKNNIHKANSPKLKKLFDRYRPDAVICTQAFPCGMVADYKKTYSSSVPLIAVLTDYIPHAYWVYDTVDYYIVPTEDIAATLIKRGVPSVKVKPLGIPFSPKFNQQRPKEELLKNYNLKGETPIILIMGGGQGLGPIKEIVKSLERVKEEIQEIVVTGTNSRLYNTLKRRIRRYKKKILLFGYTHRINEFMDLADIIISKPGGITTAEALSKGKPMIIIKPLPGQEANNAAYLTSAGAAIKVDSPKEAYLAVDELIKNPDKFSKLRESAKKIAKPKASIDIAEFILKEIKV
ncbi:MAG: glycosyltransferase [Candidatus Omnitrophota bacterium]